MCSRTGQLIAYLILAGLAVAATAAAEESPPESRPRVIILLSIDTLRTDALSCMGCQRPTTPFLDSLAEQGTLFSRAYSSSWTVPAVASMLTSLHASSHGVTHGSIGPGPKGEKIVHSQPVLSGALVTLAELLRDAGYRTIGVAANRHLQEGSGFEQGFDHYFEQASFCNAERLNATVRRLMTEIEGEDWQRTWKRTPTFLWVHYFDPHHFYTPRRPWILEYAPDFQTSPEAFPSRVAAEDLNTGFDPSSDTELVRRLTALYHSEVRYTDEYARRLLADLDPGDDALVVFTSDHGEELGDRSMFGHRNTLFDEVSKVPLFIVRPSSLPQGKRIDTVVSIIDILPTIAEAAGCSLPDGIHGHSLLPLLSGTPGYQHEAALLELHPPYGDGLRALISDHWKLVRPFDKKGPPALYDLDADPQELLDVRSRKRATVKRLRRQLDSLVKSLPDPPEQQLFSNDDEQDIELLRAIGYVE